MEKTIEKAVVKGDILPGFLFFGIKSQVQRDRTDVDRENAITFLSTETKVFLENPFTPTYVPNDFRPVLCI